MTKNIKKKFKQRPLDPGHCAKAKLTNVPISTRQSIEISHHLRYKTTVWAKKYLEEVIKLVKPIPFKRFIQDTGHKKGMAAGRFPIKASKQFLLLLESVEANAQNKGLDVSNLKIIKVVANKAAIPQTGGRLRHAAKRSHVEIEVCELPTHKKEAAKPVEKNKPIKTEGKSQ